MARLPLTFSLGLGGSSFEEVLATATAAEAAGFDHVSFGDRPQAPGLDGWTLATAIAARTERVRVFHSTLNLPYRYPQLLAKQAASLDVISGGRLDLCLGAGGTTMASDYDAYGIPMRPVSERLDDLIEAISLMRSLWRQEKVTYEGKHYHLHDAVCEPKPVQGLIPIWTGAGKPRGLRIVGRLADGLLKNQGWGNLEEIETMKATVNASALKSGRDPDTIRFVLGGACYIAATKQESDAYKRENPTARGLVGTIEEILSIIKAYHDAGVDTFQLRLAGGPQSLETMKAFAREVIPAAKAMTA